MKSQINLATELGYTIGIACMREVNYNLKPLVQDVRLLLHLEKDVWINYKDYLFG